MLKRILLLLVITLSLVVQVAVNPVQAAGMKSYIDNISQYKFLYPNGWVQVKVNNADVVFHDLIEPSENVSVVVSQVGKDKKLVDLGTPSEVGYKLSKNAIAPEGSGRVAELVDARSKEVKGKTYYILEYAVTLPNQLRHNLATVVISRGKLFTFNASTTDKRWTKMQNVLKEVVESFNVA